MKTPFLNLPAALALALVAMAVASANALESSELEKAVADIKNYQFGESHASLCALEDLIRRSQRPAERRLIERELVKLLEADATPDCKQFICRQLWFIGTAESVPALAKLLRDDRTVEMACYALASNPSPVAAKALRDALPALNGARLPGRQAGLLAVIQAITVRRDAEAGPALSRLALADDPAVAEAALNALGEIGSPLAVKTLARIRSGSQLKLRQAATHACLKSGERLAAQGKRRDAAKIFRELNREKEPAVVRRAALQGLVAVSESDTYPLLLAALSKGDLEDRRAAIGCVPLLKGRDAAQRLANALPGLPPEAQALLIHALAERGDAAALPAINRAARDGDAEVRVTALKALGTIGDARAVPTLLDKAAQGDASEQAAARTSLRSLRGDSVDAALLQCLKNTPATQRPEVIETLADRNVARAVPPLLTEAAGADDPTRRAAFKAVGRLADQATIPALIQLLVQLEGDVAREEAEQAVIQLAHKIADKSRRADAVVAAVVTTRSVPARCSLLRVLGALANAEALETVKAASRETDPAVRDVAVRALVNWPDDSALEALAGISQSAADPTHRALAFRGYLRLLAQSDHAPKDVLERYTQALRQAQTAGERKLVLAGLGTIADVEAIRLVEPLLDDGAVSAEAAQAAVQLARGLSGAHPQEARALLARLLAGTADETRRRQAEEALQQIEAAAGYITAWEVAGPYSREGRDFRALFDIAFAPETPEAKVAWRLLPAGSDPKRPWVLDLLRLYGGEQRVAYARTRIHSDTAQPALLELGTDDGVKVWLNAELVHAHNVARPRAPGADKVNIQLRAGWNPLLLKITQNNQGWEFCARLVKPDGAALQGIRLDCEQR